MSAQLNHHVSKAQPTGPNSFIETLTHSKEESFVLNFVIETVTLVKQIQKYFEIKLVLDVNSKFILVAL